MRLIRCLFLLLSLILIKNNDLTYFKQMNMRHFKYYCLLTLLLLASVPSGLWAQNTKIIRGVVKDKSDQLPLPGANVIIKNENDRFIKGVTTDVDGRYAIEVTIPNAILQVTFIGYKAFSVPVTNQVTLNVDLEPESHSIGEVVVSAKAKPKVDMGYMKIDARDNAASVVSVDLKEIAPSSATSAIEMMQGRAAGVQITAESGDPGAGYSIRIRGNTSLNSSNNPLIVIDGIQYTGDVGSFSDVSELMTSRSPIQDVHPDDIEAIEVLKDAGSTAIYGSRGANGVILITTKRGRANYTQITLSSNASVQFAPSDIPLLSGDDLKIFILEGMQNQSGYTSRSSNLVYPELRDDPTRSDYYQYNNNTDWVKEVQQTGYTLKNNLSLSGGGNSTVYRFSLGNVNQRGTGIGTGYSMFSTRFALDYTISKNLQLSTSIGYTRSDTKKGGADVGFQNVLEAARKYPSFYPVYWRDEDGNTLDRYYIPRNKDIYMYSKDLYNPVAWGNLVKHGQYTNAFVSSVSLNFNIMQGLSLESRVNLNFSNNSFDIFVPQAATNRNWNDSKANVTRKGQGNSQYIGQENRLAYTKTLNEIHVITATGVAKFDWWNNSDFAQSASNTGSSQVTNMQATNRWSTPSSSRGHDVSNTWIAMAHYKLLDRYIIQTTLNYEGSSKFGKSNRYGLFPQVALSWRISGEPFLSSFAFMDDVKFRYSWGKSGQTPTGQYLYFSNYDAGSSYIDKVGTMSSGIQLNTLRWEVTTANNLAIDAELFKHRVRFTAEIYDRMTNDLLMNRTLPSTSGYGDYLTNYGTIRNRGFEFDGRVSPVYSSDWIWEIYGNVAVVRNKIMELPGDSKLETDWYSGYPFKVYESDPIGSFYGLRHKGVYASEADAVARDKDGNALYDMDGKLKPVRWDNAGGVAFQAGDAIYEDLNHDGLINDMDRTIIGHANPDFYGGLGTKLVYKNWTLDVFFQYQYGNDVINLIRKDLETMDGGNDKNTNQSRSVMRRWRKQGDVTDMPRVTFNTNHNTEGSDRFVENASYCRLKSVVISYQLPATFLSKVGIKRASAFINGYNLLTFTKYKGVDPEIRATAQQGHPFRVGLDTSRTPIAKSITAGLNVTF